MLTNNKHTRLWLGIGLAIALVQLFDIAIHVATNQAEPLRILSNVVVLLWVAGRLFGWIGGHLRTTAVASVSAYFLLNLIFLAREGVTNEAQRGELRVVLLGLVFITVGMSAVWGYLR